MCRRRLRRGMVSPAPSRALDGGDAGGFDADAAPHGRHARPRLRKMASKCQRRHEPPVRHCRTPGEVADAMKKTRNNVNINCLSHSAKASGESARHARQALAALANGGEADFSDWLPSAGALPTHRTGQCWNRGVLSWEKRGIRDKFCPFPCAPISFSENAIHPQPAI